MIKEINGVTPVLTTVNECFPQDSFAAILRRSLGKVAWNKLHSAIRVRFMPSLTASKSLLFKGNMQWVYCSPIGALIARLLQRFSILPGVCEQGLDFDFRIFLENGGIKKERRYYLSPTETFIFTSRFSEHPKLHEEFAGGFGMFLKLSEENGELIFRDDGYFFKLGKWRLSLPRWLSVGSFELLHRNIDQHRFQVIIRVAHPILGTLFYQRGEFYDAG